MLERASENTIATVDIRSPRWFFAHYCPELVGNQSVISLRRCNPIKKLGIVNMNCQHTGQPFSIETESVPSPRIVVLREQVEQVKAALTRDYVPFIIDYEGYRSLGKSFCVFSFRPDADATVIETTLKKAK